jgi:hypothetical protein
VDRRLAGKDVCKQDYRSVVERDAKSWISISKLFLGNQRDRAVCVCVCLRPEGSICEKPLPFNRVFLADCALASW